MLMIYVCLYWLLELVVFYSLVCRGYIRKVSVQLLPKYFSCDCSTDSISCSEWKKTEEKNIKTRQQIKKVWSKRCCRRQSTWLIIALLSHWYRSDVASLSLCFHSVVAMHYALMYRARLVILVWKGSTDEYLVVIVIRSS